MCPSTTGFSTVSIPGAQQSLALPGSQFWVLSVTRGTVSRDSTYKVLPPSRSLIDTVWHRLGGFIFSCADIGLSHSPGSFLSGRKQKRWSRPREASPLRPVALPCTPQAPGSSPFHSGPQRAREQNGSINHRDFKGPLAFVRCVLPMFLLATC